MNLGLNKRQKIIVVAVILTFGLLSTQLVNFSLRFRFLTGVSILAFLLSLWALWEGINKTKALVILILPTLYTLAVASAYFLLPVRWLTRIPLALFFGLTIYLLLLAQNVFNVSSARTIPLYRAAFTGSFISIIATAFFIFQVIWAFKMIFFFNGLFVAVVSFALSLSLFWAIKMEDRLTGEVLVPGLLLSLIMGELAMAFSFWPMVPLTYSIILISALYVLLGLSVDNARGRVTRGDTGIYLAIVSFIWVLAFLVTSWTG